MPLNEKAIYATSYYVRYASRRSVVHGTNGMVASSQPLASEAGQRILKMGGNAADAAVAVAAALNVTEPTSTGIGGDMFCLYFDAKTKRIRALNGSGRSAKNTTLAQVRKECDMKPGVHGKIPAHSGLAVTVPGAAAGWCDTVEMFGSGNVTLEQILTPAIELAENGFPVSELSANFWQKGEQGLKDASPNFRETLKKDPKAEQFYRAPRAGEIMHMKGMAETFRVLGREGKKGFYTGRIAKAIVEVVEQTGGHLTLQDLEDHLNTGTEETNPISFKFHGQNIGRGPFPREDGASDGYCVELWEHPPNGQGIVALMTLGVLQQLERDRKIMTFSQEDHNSVPYLHAIIESLRIVFADAEWWINDPVHSKIRHVDMLGTEYLAERAKLFDPEKAGKYSYGQPPGPSPAQNHCDTVYFSVTDKEGNGCSFINSLYTGFGACIIPQGCGFHLQSRACNFTLGPEDHPNIYAPGKRPYHTIIPALLTHGDGPDRQLHSVYGVMGGFMQPQGHVQVLMNMEVFGMNPQQALDAPRICLGAGLPDLANPKDNSMTVFVEEGIDDEVVVGLRKMGHQIEVLNDFDRTMFGRGQIIRRHVDQATGIPVYSAGSDLRGDGCAIPA